MKITHFKMSGWDSAIRCMYMTKNTYNEDLEKKLCEAEKICLHSSAGRPISKDDDELIRWYQGQKNTAIKMGAVHYNVLKHVDFTCTVVGLHRGGQDDLDAHAERFDTRIIRMSTRDKNNTELTEISDYYKGKILTFGDLCKKFNLPEAVTFNDAIFIRTPLGYVREDCVDDKDVRRGHATLATASTFTFKCDIAEFCHVFRERCEDGNAHPELKELVEKIAKKINYLEPDLTRDFFLTKCIQ